MKPAKIKTWVRIRPLAKEGEKGHTDGAAVEKQLMGRDTVSEEKLQRIRAVISAALEKGHFGTLPPLEREPKKPKIDG